MGFFSRFGQKVAKGVESVGRFGKKVADKVGRFAEKASSVAKQASSTIANLPIIGDVLMDTKLPGSKQTLGSISERIQESGAAVSQAARSAGQVALVGQNIGRIGGSAVRGEGNRADAAADIIRYANAGVRAGSNVVAQAKGIQRAVRNR